ncbi:Invasion protein InvG [Salmonella enterica subsp. enterica serovar Urbana str. R8-2977]|uniref:Invasion protein InvG n=1 Tax=Salmonella enterica subsp. enterica serovar Urbana str. R8-2977 TaxID=913084 RepID=G5RZR4_SALET|nr:Invasion protein InvG [Salmonella enterica subsp. enterica serovar Urbana str. R8-2977]
MKTHILLARVLACAALVLVAPGYSSEKIPVTGSGFVAKDDSLRTFFDAMALQLKEPVIVSKMAARKKVIVSKMAARKLAGRRHEKKLRATLSFTILTHYWRSFPYNWG